MSETFSRRKRVIFLSVALAMAACGRKKLIAAGTACGRTAEYGHRRTGNRRQYAPGRNSPLKQIGIYPVGFHPMKDNPAVQMEAHHYCNQVNEDFCPVFSSMQRKESNMTGIECIISEKLFNALPEGDRKYWRPHNHEILSGQLVGTGLPAVAEKELMRKKMNSYGVEDLAGKFVSLA